MIVEVEEVIFTVVGKVVGKKKKVNIHFVVLENEDEEIPELSKYFFIDALGRKGFIKTNNRSIAQQAVDAWAGKGKYSVICSRGESLKGDATVRATAFRKGQTQQRLKSKILNS